MQLHAFNTAKYHWDFELYHLLQDLCTYYTSDVHQFCWLAHMLQCPDVWDNLPLSVDTTQALPSLLGLGCLLPHAELSQGLTRNNIVISFLISFHIWRCWSLREIQCTSGSMLNTAKIWEATIPFFTTKKDGQIRNQWLFCTHKKMRLLMKYHHRKINLETQTRSTSL